MAGLCLVAAAAAQPTLLAPWPTPDTPCVRALSSCAFALGNERGEEVRAVPTALPGVFEACLNGSEWVVHCDHVVAQDVVVRAADACAGAWSAERTCDAATVTYRAAAARGWLWAAGDAQRLTAATLALEVPFDPVTARATVFWVPTGEANCAPQAWTLTPPARCGTGRGADRFAWDGESPSALATVWALALVLWCVDAARGNTWRLASSMAVLLGLHPPLVLRVSYAQYVVATAAGAGVGGLLLAAWAPRACREHGRTKLPDPARCRALQHAALGPLSLLALALLTWSLPVSVLH